MGILLVLLSAQEGQSPEDLVRLLQEVRIVLETESETTESAVENAGRTIAAADATARLDRPSARRALWQALLDPDLTSETRLLIIQALQRLGELSGFMETLAALGQFGVGDSSDGSVREKENRTVKEQVTIEPIPAGRARNLSAPAPAPKADDKAARRNTVLGIASLSVVALLLLLRKGP